MENNNELNLVFELSYIQGKNLELKGTDEVPKEQIKDKSLVIEYDTDAAETKFGFKLPGEDGINFESVELSDKSKSMVMNLVKNYFLHNATQKEVERLWESLEDVGMSEDKDGELMLDEDWFVFPKGTTRDQLWVFFDVAHKRGISYLVNEYEPAERNIRQEKAMKKEPSKADLILDCLDDGVDISKTGEYAFSFDGERAGLTKGKGYSLIIGKEPGKEPSVRVESAEVVDGRQVISTTTLLEEPELGEIINDRNFREELFGKLCAKRTLINAKEFADSIKFSTHKDGVPMDFAHLFGWHQLKNPDGSTYQNMKNTLTDMIISAFGSEKGGNRYNFGELCKDTFDRALQRNDGDELRRITAEKIADELIFAPFSSYEQLLVTHLKSIAGEMVTEIKKRDYNNFSYPKYNEIEITDDFDDTFQIKTQSWETYLKDFDEEFRNSSVKMLSENGLFPYLVYFSDCESFGNDDFFYLIAKEEKTGSFCRLEWNEVEGWHGISMKGCDPLYIEWKTFKELRETDSVKRESPVRDWCVTDVDAARVSLKKKLLEDCWRIIETKGTIGLGSKNNINDDRIMLSAIDTMLTHAKDFYENGSNRQLAYGSLATLLKAKNVINGKYNDWSPSAADIEDRLSEGCSFDDAISYNMTLLNVSISDYGLTDRDVKACEGLDVDFSGKNPESKKNIETLSELKKVFKDKVLASDGLNYSPDVFEIKKLLKEPYEHGLLDSELGRVLIKDSDNSVRVIFSDSFIKSVREDITETMDERVRKETDGFSQIADRIINKLSGIKKKNASDILNEVGKNYDDNKGLVTDDGKVLEPFELAVLIKARDAEYGKGFFDNIRPDASQIEKGVEEGWESSVLFTGYLESADGVEGTVCIERCDDMDVFDSDIDAAQQWSKDNDTRILEHKKDFLIGDKDKEHYQYPATESNYIAMQKAGYLLSRPLEFDWSDFTEKDFHGLIDGEKDYVNIYAGNVQINISNGFDEEKNRRIYVEYSMLGSNPDYEGGKTVNEIPYSLIDLTSWSLDAFAYEDGERRNFEAFKKQFENVCINDICNFDDGRKALAEPTVNWNLEPEKAMKKALDISNQYVKNNLGFLDDIEKMIDFSNLEKAEFLTSYSYVTEEEYDATQKALDERNMTPNDYIDSLAVDVNLNLEGAFKMLLENGGVIEKDAEPGIDRIHFKGIDNVYLDMEGKNEDGYDRYCLMYDGNLLHDTDYDGKVSPEHCIHGTDGTWHFLTSDNEVKFDVSEEAFNMLTNPDLSNGQSVSLSDAAEYIESLGWHTEIENDADGIPSEIWIRQSFGPAEEFSFCLYDEGRGASGIVESWNNLARNFNVEAKVNEFLSNGSPYYKEELTDMVQAVKDTLMDDSKTLLEWEANGYSEPELGLPAACYEKYCAYMDGYGTVGDVVPFGDFIRDIYPKKYEMTEFLQGDEELLERYREEQSRLNESEEKEVSESDKFLQMIKDELMQPENKNNPHRAIVAVNQKLDKSELVRFRDYIKEIAGKDGKGLEGFFTEKLGVKKNDVHKKRNKSDRSKNDNSSLSR